VALGFAASLRLTFPLVERAPARGEDDLTTSGGSG
jgi:hypothetical protein